MADRGLARGDVAVIDLACFTETSDGERVPIPSATQEKFRLLTDEDDRQMLPGLVEGILGAKYGEEREFRVTFPKLWQPRQLAGSEAVCQVKVREVLSFDLEPLTDKDAVTIAGPDCSSLADARQRLLAQAAEARLEVNQRKVHEALMDAVAACVELEVPETLLDEHARTEYQAKLIDLQQQGRLPAQAMAQLATPEMLAKFIEAQSDELNDQIKVVLAMSEICSQEGLNVTEEEIDEEIAPTVKQFNEQGAEFDMVKLREQALQFLQSTKVVDWLTTNASVTLDGEAVGVGSLKNVV